MILKIQEEMGFVGKRQLTDFDPEIISAGMLADYLLVVKQKQLGSIPDIIRQGLVNVPEVSPTEVMTLADRSLNHPDLEDDMEEFWTKLEKREEVFRELKKKILIEEHKNSQFHSNKRNGDQQTKSVASRVYEAHLKLDQASRQNAAAITTVTGMNTDGTALNNLKGVRPGLGFRG